MSKIAILDFNVNKQTYLPLFLCKMLPNIDLCRLCAQKKKIKRPIFEISQNLPEMIKECVNLDVTMSDSLPKSICCECQKCVEQFLAFKKKCADAELILTEIANGQASVKKLATIKQELESVEEPLLPIINSDHTYSSTSPAIRIVKTEVRDDLLPEQDDDNCDQDIYLGDLVHEIPIPDVKQYVVDLPDDTEETQLQEKTFQEVKPIIDENFAEIDEAENIEIWVEPTGKIKPSEEYLNEDLMLKDGEQCDIDMEEMEATIRKAKNPDVRFNCSFCTKSFKFYKGLKKHESNHATFGQNYSCHFCTERQVEFHFATLETLKRHLFTQHLQDGGYQCRSCSRCFRTNNLYNLHLKMDHGVNKFGCRVCGKECANRSSFNDHMRLHSGIKPYSCTKCGKKFKWLSSLKWHLRSHKKQKDFLCSQCGLELSSRTSLVEHFNTHSGEKPFSCSNCHMSFSHKVSLKRHEALHEAPKYKCVTCNKRFSQQNVLKEHQLSHTGDRPITCKICNTQFRRQSCYSKHARIHRSKTFKCDKCDFTCHRADTLKSHTVRHTGSRHMCPALGCLQSYTQRTPLLKHFKRTHPGMEMGARKPTSHSGPILYNFSYKRHD